VSTYTKTKRDAYWNNREASLAKSAAYYRANSARIKDAFFIRKYGATRAELISRLGARCGCCGTINEPTRRGWHIDHDHHTGRIRGLLCLRCNTGIGKLGDSIEGVMRAVAYLKNGATK
jgi:hypothetical protein